MKELVTRCFTPSQPVRFLWTSGTPRKKTDVSQARFIHTNRTPLKQRMKEWPSTVFLVTLAGVVREQHAALVEALVLSANSDNNNNDNNDNNKRAFRLFKLRTNFFLRGRTSGGFHVLCICVHAR